MEKFIAIVKCGVFNKMSTTYYSRKLNDTTTCWGRSPQQLGAATELLVVNISVSVLSKPLNQLNKR